jgi:hypothetical protein
MVNRFLLVWAAFVGALWGAIAGVFIAPLLLPTVTTTVEQLASAIGVSTLIGAFVSGWEEWADQRRT